MHDQIDTSTDTAKAAVEDHRGPQITSDDPTETTVQIRANGAPLVLGRKDTDSGSWLLPYPLLPAEDGDTLFFGSVAELVDQVAWDARQLSQEMFARAYPKHVLVTTRELDATTYAVERAGVLVAFVHEDPDTGRWHVVDAAHQRHTHSGYQFRDTAVEHVMGRVVAFSTIAAAHRTGTSRSKRSRFAGAA